MHTAYPTSMVLWPFCTRRNAIASLARVDEAHFTIAEHTSAPDQAVTQALGEVIVYLPLAGLVDLDAERARLKGELDELEKLVAGILEQLTSVSKTLDTLQTGHHVTAQSLKEADQRANDAQREFEKQITALQKDIEEFRRWAEKNGTADLKTELGVWKEKTAKVEATQEKAAGRAWALLPNVVGAVVNGLIAAAVAYSIARR